MVLDAGGGTGRWTIRVAKLGCNVVLMDSSDGMLEIATKRIRDYQLQQRITVKKGDITNTGYPSESFDLVLCEHAFFLFEDPDIVLRELQRILKKNARLIVSAQNRYVQSFSSLSGKPSADNVERALNVLMSNEHECMAEDGKVKIYSWTPGEFSVMLERNNLRVEKMIGKVTTMPLRIRKETYLQKDYPQELFDKLLQLELAICEEPDALALAGHLQAITQKI